jgi:hypothetical protein
VFFTNYILRRSFQGHERQRKGHMGRAYNILVRKPVGRDHFGDLIIDGKIVL